jgi:uridylate kinase
VTQKYKRILLKLSGEVLSPLDKSAIFDEEKIIFFADQIAKLKNDGFEVAIVVGGGNIFRKRDNYLSFLDDQSADWVGINATILNGIVLKSALTNKFNCNSKIISYYDYQGIINKMENNIDDEFNKNVIISVAMGVPGYSTDTIAANLANDLKCDIIIKGTKVDGVYNKDPKKYDDATMYDELKFDDAIEQDLAVMDQESYKICKKNNVPIRVVNIYESDNLIKVANGENIGTIIK